MPASLGGRNFRFNGIPDCLHLGALSIRLSNEYGVSLLINRKKILKMFTNKFRFKNPWHYYSDGDVVIVLLVGPLIPPW